jgi:glutamyl-tRNA reductase
LHTPVTSLRAPQQRSERQNALLVVERLFDLVQDDEQER